MPCNTITTVQVKLKPEIIRADWLIEAIKQVVPTRITEQGTDITWATGWYNRTTGMLTERSKTTADAIRKSYAATLTKRTLGRAGWQLKTVEQGGR